MSVIVKRNMIIVMVIMMIFCVTGQLCTEDSYAAQKKIHLKKTTISLMEGKTYQQKLIDKKGKTISATKVKWKSLKTSVAKISKKGKITAVKKGTAKMTAKYKGKTYKFKVTVKASPYNTYIDVDQSSIEIDIGQTATLIVYTDKGQDITCTYDDNVDCEWGDWFNGGVDSYFYITGLAEGTSVVKVYDSHNKSVYKNIRVTVKHEPKDLAMLYDYIQKNGSVDDDYHRYITGEGPENSFVVITNTDSETINFMYVISESNVQGFAQMDLVLPKSTSAAPEVYLNMRSGAMLAEASMNVSTFTENTSLNFKNSGGTLTPDQTICNSLFQLAMTTWGITMNDIGFTMSDLGFTNYD